MKRTHALTLSAALGAGLMLAAPAQAEERDFDRMRSDRASEGEAVAVRWSMPFGGAARQDSAEGARLSLRFTQAGAGAQRSMDVISYSFAADGADGRIESPFVLRAAGDGEGGWLSSTQNKVLFGIGAALLVWGIVEATEDDDETPAPPPPPPPS